MQRVVFLIGVLLLFGCKEEIVQKVDPPLEFQSQKANYTMKLSSRWSREDPRSLNTHAEFAASYANTIYVIVIPQELPSFPNVAPPDSLALKRASMSVMTAQIDELAVDRQGPVKVDGQLAQLVIAQGNVEGQKVKYATTYVTHLGWGYQIVAWGPSEHASLVVSQADEFLAGWNFREPTPSRNPLPDSGIESLPDGG